MVAWDGQQVLERRRYKTGPVPDATAGLKLPPSGLLAPDLFKGLDEERIEWLVRKAIAFVKRHQPLLVAIEGYDFGHNFPGTAVRHELCGVLKYRLRRIEQSYVLVPPKTLKKDATGNGNAKKTDMIVAAKEFCSEISCDDEADALLLARYALLHYNTLTD